MVLFNKINKTFLKITLCIIEDHIYIIIDFSFQILILEQLRVIFSLNRAILNRFTEAFLNL